MMRFSAPHRLASDDQSPVNVFFEHVGAGELVTTVPSGGTAVGEQPYQFTSQHLQLMEARLSADASCSVFLPNKDSFGDIGAPFAVAGGMFSADLADLANFECSPLDLGVLGLVPDLGSGTGSSQQGVPDVSDASDMPELGHSDWGMPDFDMTAVTLPMVPMANTDYCSEGVAAMVLPITPMGNDGDNNCSEATAAAEEEEEEEEEMGDEDTSASSSSGSERGDSPVTLPTTTRRTRAKGKGKVKRPRRSSGGGGGGSGSGRLEPLRNPTKAELLLFLQSVEVLQSAKHQWKRFFSQAKGLLSQDEVDKVKKKRRRALGVIYARDSRNKQKQVRNSTDGQFHVVTAENARLVLDVAELTAANLALRSQIAELKGQLGQ
jgi:hypothetical protein